MMSFKKIRSAIVLSMAFCSTLAYASSPDSWNRYFKEIKDACLKETKLKQAHISGGIITFGNNLGIEAVMISGLYRQPHMKNQQGKELCLFKRATKAEVFIQEADDILNTLANKDHSKK